MKGGMLMQSSFKAKEDLPAVLSAKDISKYLGISKANSYQLYLQHYKLQSLFLLIFVQITIAYYLIILLVLFHLVIF